MCNTFGTCNNVVTVRSSDFEVFEALSIDSVSMGRDVHSEFTSWFCCFRVSNKETVVKENLGNSLYKEAINDSGVLISDSGIKGPTPLPSEI